MKTPDEILAKTENGLPRPSWTSRIPTGEAAQPHAQISVATKAHINMIFARFMAIYGHKFKSCFETENEIRLAKREWALSLEGYGEALLVAAVNRCKESLAWMPTVSEFLAILRDLEGDLGLPTPVAAYQEACLKASDPRAHQWSHAAVYWAGKEVGWFRLRSEEASQIQPVFAYTYDQLCQRVRRGESLQLPVIKAIEDKQDNSTAVFILAFAKQQGISEDLLYYLTKPKGSQVRERLRAQAQAKLDAQGVRVTLPEDTSLS